MTEPIVATRMANALFAEARSAIVDVYGAIERATAQRRAKEGGLWVGGKAELTGVRLRFAPNAINKAVHIGGAALSFDIPLNRISAVRLRKAFVTNIVEVETVDGIYSLRCWGAGEFARAIDGAVRSVRLS